MEKNKNIKVGIISCLIIVLILFTLLFNVNFKKIFAQITGNFEVNDFTKSDKVIINFGDSTEEFLCFSVNNKEDNHNIIHYLNLDFLFSILSDELKDEKITAILEHSFDKINYSEVSDTIIKINENNKLTEVNDYKINYGNNYYRISFNNESTKLKIGKDILGKLSVFANSTFDYDFKGEYQEFEAPLSGQYQIELWGARGNYYMQNSKALSGNGAYTKGEINLMAGTKLYVYVGKNSIDDTSIENSWEKGGYNGGGQGAAPVVSSNTTYHYAGGGGGATDVRYFENYDIASNSTVLDWDSELGLNSRIMVAGAGGGSYYAEDWAKKPDTGYYENCSGIGGDAGGLVGYEGESLSVKNYQTAYKNGLRTRELVVKNPTGGTQTSGGLKASCTEDDTICINADPNDIFGHRYSKMDGSFGIGATRSGGGGYYGGAGAAYLNLMSKARADSFNLGTNHTSGAGGSSFISGHDGCVAITSSSDRTPKTGSDKSVHYSGLSFTNTKMIDGRGLSWTDKVEETPTSAMPNPNGGYYELGEGHKGSGAARITLLSAEASAYSTIEIKETKEDSKDEETEIEESKEDSKKIETEINEPYKVIILYVDENDNELADKEIITNQDGKKEYITNQKEIKGYTLKVKPDNYKGTFTKDEIIVKYVYTKLINPSTLDNIKKYIGILILGITMIVLLVLKNIKNKKS